MIAAAMGAVNVYPGKNLIIIDMGTAITAELVSKDKEFLGGVIMPGMKISVDALAGGTAKLTSVEIMKPEHVYGLTTTEAIQAGLYYGTAGALKEFCYQFKKNVFHGEDTLVIGTGGFARTIPWPLRQLLGLHNSKLVQLLQHDNLHVFLPRASCRTRRICKARRCK